MDGKAASRAPSAGEMRGGGVMGLQEKVLDYWVARGDAAAGFGARMKLWFGGSDGTDRDLPAKVTVEPRCRGTRKAGCAGRTQWGRQENHASHALGAEPRPPRQVTRTGADQGTMATRPLIWNRGRDPV